MSISRINRCIRKLKPGGAAADENDSAGSQKIPAQAKPALIIIKGTGRRVADENFNLRGLNSPQLAA
jgi:hypothetical protein